MRSKSIQPLALAAVLAAALMPLASPAAAQTDTVMWINHLDFLPGDPSVITDFNAVSSGVGGGLSGLIIESTTVGEDALGGGNKVVETGLQVPPGYLITGVRLCYELSSAASFVSQIRLAQVQDPPDVAIVRLDDGTDLVDPGPVCVDSASLGLAPIDPTAGAVRLDLRVNFGDIADRIVVRAVGLHLVSDGVIEGQIADLLEAFVTHSHWYLTTGRGAGHNNTVASTGPPHLDDAAEVSPLRDEATKKKKKKRGKRRRRRG